jgi:hypothetical protein
MHRAFSRNETLKETGVNAELGSQITSKLYKMTLQMMLAGVRIIH